ncbi:MAG TPA: hypothetical protein VJT54_15900 [Verrucomicrobiae bacterium]|nr:hypothetical protein [Verrucomicrobiae bacterium]
MKFDFTPEEAQPVAVAVAKQLKRQGMEIRCEVEPFEGASYRPTLVAVKSGLTIIVEAQGNLDFHRTLAGFAAWLAAGRRYVRFYLATTEHCMMHGTTLAEIKGHGVGWLVVQDMGSVIESLPARNPALVVTPHPDLRCGDCQPEVRSALIKFNEINRKDGLRDMCEIVERETEDLAVIGARKILLKMDEAAVRNMDWSGQINVLASPHAYNAGHKPIVDDPLKQDLHSFRGARNLVDHPVRTRREDKRRELQFADRMMQGSRLVAELVRLKRKIQ